MQESEHINTQNPIVYRHFERGINFIDKSKLLFHSKATANFAQSKKQQFQLN